MSTNKSKPVYRVQLCVFDSQRDYPEGEEAKRILAYYPAECSVDEQTAVVGLAEALATFASNFDQSDACSGMLAERSRWVFHTPENQISMILVADRHWLTPSVRKHDLQSILRQSYRQFVLLYGPLRPLLESDSASAKAGLQSTIHEAAARLLRSKSSDLAALQGPLSLLHGVPWMPLSRQAFTATHSLASQLSLRSLGGGQTIQGMMLLHEQYCLWSSLSQQDTTAVYQLASTVMLTAAKRPSIGKRLATATGTLRSRNAEQPQHPVQNHKAWLRHPSGFLHLASQDNQADSGLIIPIMHLQGGEEQAGLLGYCQGSMLLLLLLSQPGPTAKQTQQSVLQLVHTPLRKIDAHAREQISSTGSFHVAGFRYLCIDLMLAAVQVSPQSKVGTLSSDSLALMASARLELQSMDPDQADREVIARGVHDCWVVAMHRNGRELFLVLEGRGEIGLPGASKLAAQFCNEHLASLGL